MKLSQRMLILLVPFLVSLTGQTQKIYTYVGRIETDSVLLAWGTTEGKGNTIGRGSASLGTATIELGNQRLTSEQNWVEIRGLKPDTEYAYEVLLRGRRIGEGSVRTYPERYPKLAFFVLGDYGTGKPAQYEIAELMGREFERRKRSDNPVRFVLTTGDNIYSDRKLWVFPTRSGDKDHHWESKFFEPYESLLRHIPFYPTLGNHDAKGSETEGDLSVYLDNFFFPTAEPARYYNFSYGGLVQFFALDTTRGALDSGSLAEGGEQWEWLRQSLVSTTAPWKIAYFHHPPFNGGPGHRASLDSLRPVVALFKKFGVHVVFNGHEHNFQYAGKNEETGEVLYVVTGAGGKVRTGGIGNKMAKSNIAAWAPQRHFLLVEIEDSMMNITPLGSRPVIVRGKDGKPVPMPIRVYASLAESR